MWAFAFNSTACFLSSPPQSRVRAGVSSYYTTRALSIHSRCRVHYLQRYNVVGFGELRNTSNRRPAEADRMNISRNISEALESRESQERGGMSVLIVEDHEDTASSTAMLLRLCGYEVQVAPDGHAAVRAAEASAPDVVLLDIGLPGMDGYEVARWIKRQPGNKRPLLVAVTGRSQDEDRRRAAEVGIDLHLVKPVDPEQLRRLLERFQRIIL
jgi:CheY-like chemotaxis protein